MFDLKQASQVKLQVFRNMTTKESFELPFYDSKLQEWLVRSKVDPSEANVEALAQLLGKEMQEMVKVVVRYLLLPYRHASRSSISSTSSSKRKKPKGRTIQPTDVLVAMETIHEGSIPKPILQDKPIPPAKTSMRIVLPKSSFNKTIRSLGSRMVKALEGGSAGSLPSLRWGLEALAMIHRGVEWYVQKRLDLARTQAKRYYKTESSSSDKTEKIKLKPARARSRSSSLSTKEKPLKKPRGRSKAKEETPTANVYRYLK